MKIGATSLTLTVILTGLSFIFFTIGYICLDLEYLTQSSNNKIILTNFDSFRRLNYTYTVHHKNIPYEYDNSNVAINLSAINPTKEQSVEKDGANNTKKHSFRILHVITSIEQYDDGERGTTHNYDRLKNILMPAIKNITESVLKVKNWSIDIYLILGYNISSSPQRKQMLLDAIPQGVGIEIWDRATPYYGAVDDEMPRYDIRELHHALARQHRYVVKDKFDYYDFFSCWEDDMIITSNHIQNYLRMSNEIARLIRLAPNGKPQLNKNVNKSSPFVKQQLFWLIPGFLRVEVLSEPEEINLDSSGHNRTSNRTNIPINEVIANNEIDPRLCCNISKRDHNSIALWETNITGIGLLHINNSSMLNWVALLPCRLNNRFKEVYSHERNTQSTNPKLFAQQAGWMLTKPQLQLINRRCMKGGFLPPYNKLHWVDDGLASARQVVEFWSGGYHLFHRCGVQRILSLNNTIFSNQLLYHSSNNKQIQFFDEGRFIRADDLLGQLHTLKNNAEMV